MPLRGVRVLDLSRLLPGPFATQVLADFGADVVKVEDTGVGDLLRVIPPFVPALDGSEPAAPLSARFAQVARNKRSIALNLKTEGGKRALRALAKRADVLVEGFRPGVLERLGVGYESLRAENPRLIGCAITGYGQAGPSRDRAGHDIGYLATAGVLGISGPECGPPAPPGVQVADLSAAHDAVIGILLALRARERTGRGQLVDISLTASAQALLSIHAGAHWAGEPQRPGEGMLSGYRAGYGTFETADGRWLSVGAVEPKFWEAFVRAIGREDLLPMQLAQGDEGRHARAEVARTIRERSLGAWRDVFARVEACVAPVLTLDEALDGPDAEARRMVRVLPHAQVGLVKVLGPSIRLSETDAEMRLPPPALGEHTDEVLREAGFADAEVAALRAEGAVA